MGKVSNWTAALHCSPIYWKVVHVTDIHISSDPFIAGNCLFYQPVTMASNADLPSYTIFVIYTYSIQIQNNSWHQHYYDARGSLFSLSAVFRRSNKAAKYLNPLYMVRMPKPLPCHLFNSAIVCFDPNA